MNIPLVDLRKQYDPLKEDILQRMSTVLDGMHLFLGENVQALEGEFAAFCGASHGIGVGDGTDALHLIIRAMGIGPGDEVITVANTFVATVEAIVLAGATPVFVDIDPQTHLMDVQQVADAVTARTRAILPVHLYGQPVDMAPVQEIAQAHGLKIIEDACQAHGAEYRGQRTGSLGDAAAFSFYYSKNLGAYGEGGMVVTSDDDLAERIRMLRDHGSKERYYHDLVGCNSRLDELQAAVLRAKLPHLSAWNALRSEHARAYSALLAESSAVLPTEMPDVRHVYHLYAIRVPQRDALRARLQERGVGTGIHYPVPIHLQRAYAYLGYQGGDLPVTESAAREILSLPMYPELADNEIAYVADAVREFFGEKALTRTA